MKKNERKNKIIIVYNSIYYIYLFRINLIRQLIKNGFEVVVIAHLDQYTDELKELDFKYIPLDIDPNGLNPINDVSLMFRLFRIYKKEAPDIILHYTIKPNIYGSIAARINHIPVINTITGLGTVFLRQGFLQLVAKKMYSFSLRKVYMVFFQNKDDRDLFIENKLVDSEKTDIIPGSGVNTNKYKPMENFSESNKIIFLFVGRIIKDKGVIEYVKAAKEIKKNFDNVEFQMVGQLGSPNSGAISKSQLLQWQNENLINYLGTTDDIRVVISQVDCVVLPSYREGTSRSLLEAASMAKPIISSDVPGCNNIVDDGENGFLCKVKDSLDLASKMDRMMKLTIKERKKMGLKGRNKVIIEFDESIVIEKYLNEIQKVIEY